MTTTGFQSPLDEKPGTLKLVSKAREIVDRLLAIEDRDDAVLGLSANIKEALSQNLRDQDRFAEAIALQQEVVAGRRTRSAKEQSAKSIGDLGFSLMILELIARDSRDRELTCASWREAQTIYRALKSRNELLGFHESFLAGLESNIAK